MKFYSVIEHSEIFNEGLAKNSYYVHYYHVLIYMEII